MHVNDGMPELETVLYHQSRPLADADTDASTSIYFQKMFIPDSAFYSENTFQNDSHDRAPRRNINSNILDLFPSA
jgi:hypothetical protein